MEEIKCEVPVALKIWLINCLHFKKIIAHITGVSNCHHMLFQVQHMMPNNSSQLMTGLQSANMVSSMQSSSTKQSYTSYKVNNLFVTSKNETTNSPIHQFTNLKCCIKTREPFKTPF